MWDSLHIYVTVWLLVSIKWDSLPIYVTVWLLVSIKWDSLHIYVTVWLLVSIKWDSLHIYVTVWLLVSIKWPYDTLWYEVAIIPTNYDLTTFKQKLILNQSSFVQRYSDNEFIYLKIRTNTDHCTQMLEIKVSQIYSFQTCYSWEKACLWHK